MKNKNSLLKGVLLGIGLTVIGGALVLGWPYLKTFFSSDVNKTIHRYAGNLYVLQHDFVYAVTIETEDQKNTVYMVKGPQDQFDVWKPGLTTNRVYATAFMVDSSGDCITSGYAITPWFNKTDSVLLIGLLKKEFGLSDYWVSIKGVSLRLALKKYDQAQTDTSMVNYRPIGITGKEANDLSGFIIPASPVQGLKIRTVNFQEEINVDPEKLYAFSPKQQDGFGTGPSMPEIILLEKYAVYNTAFYNFRNTAVLPVEGAPVFNSKGNLIGVYSAYNFKADSVNNVLSCPIRKSTELNLHIWANTRLPLDESFILFNTAETVITPDVAPAPAPHDWVTVRELSENSNFDTNTSGNPYSTEFWNLGSVNVQTNEAWWHAPDIRISGQDARLLVKVKKLVKDNQYLTTLKVSIFEKNEKGESGKEIVSFRYDQKGSFSENLWSFNGFYEIRVEAMDGSLFTVSLQTGK